MSYPSNHDGDQALPDSYAVTASELRQFIERIEQLEAEKKETGDLIREVYAEAKGRGYDGKILRMTVTRRKKDREQLEEEAALLEMYEDALLV